MKEGSVAQRARLRLSEWGAVNWRNNNGACYDVNGRLIRYGLGNESEELQKQRKSPDYVGIQPLLITPEWVGHTVGRFVGIETKASDWKLTPGDDRAQAQLVFHRLVRQYGGVAGFVTGPDDVDRILRGEVWHV